MINRKLVYLFAFIFTFTLAVPALADTAPGPPSVTSTTLTAEAITADPGTQFEVLAVLEDDEGSALEGYDVEFTFDGETKVGTTGPEGEATQTFTAPSSEGTYDYDAYFGGTENYDYSSDTATVSTGAEVRTVSSSKKDHSGCRVKGRYSLTLFERSYRPGGKRKSCVLIHTPNRARR